MLRRHLVVLTIFTGWDWLAGLSTRLLADTSFFSILVAAILTGFWWFGIKTAQQQPDTLPTILVAAAVGTCLALLWP